MAAILILEVTRLRPVRLALSIPDAGRYERPARSERATSIIEAFAALVWLVAVALVILGEPLTVAACWLLALFTLGYLVTLTFAPVAWRRRHRLAQRL